MPRYLAPNVTLQAADSPSLDITGQRLTLHIWVYIFAHGGLVDFFQKWGGNGPYLMRINAGYLDAYVGNGGGWDEVGAPAPHSVPLHRWSSLAMVKHGTVMRIFQDGRRLAEGGSGAIIYNSSDILKLGDDDYNGMVAHAAIWGDSLDDQEIVQLAQGASPLNIRPGTLAAYWPFDDYGPSAVARDQTKNNNTFTILANTTTLQPNGPTQVNSHLNYKNFPTDPVMNPGGHNSWTAIPYISEITGA